MQNMVFYSAGIYLVHFMGQALNKIGKNKQTNKNTSAKELNIFMGRKQTTKYKRGILVIEKKESLPFVTT